MESTPSASVTARKKIYETNKSGTKADKEKTKGDPGNDLNRHALLILWRDVVPTVGRVRNGFSAKRVNSEHMENALVRKIIHMCK